jgi:hypothetical protein
MRPTRIRLVLATNQYTAYIPPKYLKIGTFIFGEDGKEYVITNDKLPSYSIGPSDLDNGSRPGIDGSEISIEVISTGREPRKGELVAIEGFPTQLIIV